MLQALVPNDLEGLMRALAHDIAMDLQPIDDLIKRYGLTQEKADDILQHPRFEVMLQQETMIWNSPLSGAERVKTKTVMLVENALPEMYTRLHDSKEALSAKVELLKTLVRVAGVNNDKTENVSVGERIQITINMGEDSKLVRDITPKPVIDYGAEDA